MQFANPDALTLFLLLLSLIGVAVGYWIWKRRVMARIGHLPMISLMIQEVSWTRQILSMGAMVLGIALLILALTQPQWGQTDRLVTRSGVDVVFALDLSRSMLARDVAPSRLDAAKHEIGTALGQLAGDRAGLVVFTAVSFAQSPLTNDYGALRFYLRKLSPEQMPFGGTSVGRAISDSVDLLVGKHESNQGDVSKMKRAENQVIVLITDGEDHESDPAQAARLARDANIHIVTVGFGSARGEHIPTYSEDGSITGYKRDRSGELVTTRLDESSLKRLAEATGGAYIPYEGENSVAYALIDYINQLEKSELEAMMKQRYKERFFFFLAPGLLLVLLSFALGDRRNPLKPRVGQGGKVNAPTRGLIDALVLPLSLLLVLLLTTGCEDLLVTEVKSVARGNEAVERGDFQAALDAYEEAAKELPPSPELAYDEGRARMGLPDQSEQAQALLARALETQDPSLRFDALYNLGLVLAAQKKWKEAHDTFKQALVTAALDPSLREAPGYADAVHNLEVVWQELFPPCATLEDDLEENDSPEQASKLEEMSLKDRVSCGGDDDLYVIPVVPGTQVSVSATFEDLREVLDPEHRFLPDPQDLKIEILDRSGQHVWASDPAEGGEGAEVKTTQGAGGERHSVARRIERFTVTPQMLPEGANELLLRVRSAEEREFSYSLDITAIPPCGALEDDFEDNDDSSQAKPLEPGEHPLHMCGGDEDWFTFSAELGDSVFVDVIPGKDEERGAPPKLKLELYDDKGKLVLEGSPEGNLLTLALWEVQREGSYDLRIHGEDGDQQGPYQLALYHYAPCPAGDDRFEENDTASSAAALDAQTQAHRYLRLCEGDADFFQVALPEPKPDKAQGGSNGVPQKLAGMMPPQQGGAPVANAAATQKRKLALSVVPLRPPGEEVAPTPTPAEGQELPPVTPLSFDLLSESGAQILATAKPATPPPAQPGAPPVPPVDPRDAPLVLEAEVEAAQALVRVQGPSLFYHLVRMDGGGGGESQDDSQQNQGEQDQQDEQNEGGGEDEQESQEDQKEKQDQQDGSEGDPDGEPQDEQKKPEEDQQDPEQEKQEEGAPEEEEQPPAEQQPPGEAGEPKQPELDPKMQRVEDILRALEENDDNFQMRKALENTPGRYIEKDW